MKPGPWAPSDYDFLVSRRIPVFLYRDGRPVLCTTRGVQHGRVVVTSFPKAGTYFFAALLKAVGYAEIGIHAGNSVKSGFEDHRFGDNNYICQHAHQLGTDVPIADYMRLTLDGQFFVGHIVRDDEHEKVFAEAGVKLLLAVRNLRSLLVSHMRYLTEIDRHDRLRSEWFDVEDASARLRAHNHAYAETFHALFERTWAWTQQQTVPTQVVRFEDFNRRNSRLPRDVAAGLEGFLGLERGAINDDKIRQAQATRTLTRNELPTEIKPVWNDSVEEGFIADGYAALNKKFGYA